MDEAEDVTIPPQSNIVGLGGVNISPMNLQNNGPTHNEYISYVQGDKTNEPESPSNQPTTRKDGGFGWLIVIGCFFIEGLVFGTVRSLSIFFIHFQDAFSATSNLVSWVPSISLAMLHASGVVASALSTRYGPRPVVMFGGLLASTGFALSSFSTNIVHLYVGIGAITGIGFGLAYIPSNVLVANIFDERRALAFCITSTGGPVISFVFAPLFQALVATYSWYEALRIISAIMLVIIICGMVMSSPKEPNDVTDWNEGSEVVDTTPNSIAFPTSKKKMQNKLESISEASETRMMPIDDLSLSSTSQTNLTVNTDEKFYFNRNKWKSKSFTQNVTNLKCEFHHSLPQHQNNWKRTVRFDLQNTTVAPNNQENVQPQPESAPPTPTPNEKRLVIKKKIDEANEPSITQQSGLQWKILKECSFLLYCGAGLCIGAGAFTPNVFIVAHAASRGFVDFQGAYLVSIMGGVSIVSSLASGWFATLKSVSLLYFDVFSLLLLGICCLLCPLATTYIELVVFCIGFGLFSGAVMALPFTVLAEIVGVDCLATGLGFFFMVTSVAVLLTPPVAGWLVDIMGSYDSIFYLSGVALLLAAIMVLIIAIKFQLSQRNRFSASFEGKTTRRTSIMSSIFTDGSPIDLYELYLQDQKNVNNIRVPPSIAVSRLRRQSIL